MLHNGVGPFDVEEEMGSVLCVPLCQALFSIRRDKWWLLSFVPLAETIQPGPFWIVSHVQLLSPRRTSRIHCNNAHTTE